MRESITEVGQLLRARIDCIWIQSFEEKEIIDDLRELINSERRFSNMTINLWSHTEGLTHLSLGEFEKQTPPNPKIKEFPALFSTMRETQNGDQGSSSIWVLRDFHALINDAKCQRFIRDLKEYKSRHYNPIVVISPAIELPEDVARLFRVVEYGLPSEKTVEEMVLKANATIAAAAEKAPEAGYVPVEKKDIQFIVKSCMGLTVKELDMALKESMVKFHTLDMNFLSQNKVQMVKKTGVLDYKVPRMTLDDIGGNQAIKDWLVESMNAFDDKAREFGLDKPKGYMAVGIAGCGKTAMAEAFAGMMHIPLLELSMSKVMSSLVGQSEKKIDHALQVAKACSPCVLLLDEVEKMLGGKHKLSLHIA